MNSKRPPLKTLLVILVAVFNLVLVDQVVKETAIAIIMPRSPVTVVEGLFNLSYVENRGCAWGLFQGQVWPLAIFAVAALAAIVLYRKKLFCGRLVPECLLYAGITGNLIDRLYRGAVIDMFDFHWGKWHFPCFNVADTLICVAAGLLIIFSFVDERRDRAKARARSECGSRTA